MKIKQSLIIFLLLLILFHSGTGQGTDSGTRRPGTAAAIGLQPGRSLNRLMAVGDLNFSGIEKRLIADPGYPWAGTKAVLQSATLLFGNQESPFTGRGSVYVPKKWLLRSDPRTVRSLVAAGFDLVTLANNHMLDYGPLGLEDTLFTLRQARIAHAGAGMNQAAARKAVVLTGNDGRRFAFLAYSQTFPAEFWATASRPGTAHGDPAIFTADIQKAKAVADEVIVAFHWGEELKTAPLAYQKDFAHWCIDAGAALVVGHHPHVLQGLEVYHGGLIAYSLGNFLFASYSRQCSDSIILAVDFDRRGPVRAKLYPVNVDNYQVAFQTQLRHGPDAERVIHDLRKGSAEFKTVIHYRDNIGTIEIRK